jgi:hypothetical protein
MAKNVVVMEDMPELTASRVRKHPLHEINTKGDARSQVPKLSVHDSVCPLMEADGVWDVGGRSVTVHG